MTVTHDDLMAFLRDGLHVDTSSIDTDTALFTSSLIDSFAMVELIVFLEKAGEIRMPPADVTLTNLDSVGAMLAYCATRAD